VTLDVHGHYTTAPKALEDWRNRQIAGINDPSVMPKASELKISDDELRETIDQVEAQVGKVRASQAPGGNAVLIGNGRTIPRSAWQAAR